MKSNNEQSWDEYWGSSQEKSALSRIYDVIASIYRNKLIGPRLDFELSKAFPSGGKMIHAGSGAGECGTQFRAQRTRYQTARGFGCCVRAARFHCAFLGGWRQRPGH